MKFKLTLLSVLSAIALVESEHDDLKYIKECGTDFSVSKEDLNIYIGGAMPQSSPPFQNMLLCYFKKLEIMDDAGMIIVDKMKEAIMEDLGVKDADAEKMMQLCMQDNVGGAQGAWDLEECYVKHRKTL